MSYEDRTLVTVCIEELIDSLNWLRSKYHNEKHALEEASGCEEGKAYLEGRVHASDEFMGMLNDCLYGGLSVVDAEDDS